MTLRPEGEGLPRGLGRGGAAVLAVALVAAALFAYAPVSSNGFVIYDDELYILGSQPIRRGLDAEGVAWAFTTFQGANWFPLTRLSWMLDVELFGLDPAAFHRTSVLLHCVSAVLLFAALRRLTGAAGPSAFAAAVFAVHPLHVESVAWASARKDVLSGVFWMLALLAYATYAKRADAGGGRRWGAYGLVFVSLALGSMAKPTVVVLPFVLLLLDAWPLDRLRASPGRSRAQALRRAIVEKLPLFALSALASAVTIAAQRGGDAIESLDRVSLVARLENAAVAYTEYLLRAIWPSALSPYYPHPMDSLPAWRVGVAAAVLAAISIAAWRWWRRAPQLGVGWLWFAGGLVPVIGIVQVGQAAFADRYTYLSLTGLSIAAAWTGAALAARGRRTAIFVTASALAALVAFALTTRDQVRVWRSSTTLFEHALAVTERNHVAHINLGVVATNAGRWEEAEAQLREALRIAPDSPIAHGVLGDALRGLERPDEALRQYRAALAIEPASARWLEGAGGALLDLGRSEAAAARFREALARKPTARLHESLGIALLQSGHRAEAIEQFEEALRRRPELASAHANLGAALIDDGRLDAAIEHLEVSVVLDPTRPLPRAHLGLALAVRDGPAVGLTHLEEATRLAPDRPEYYEMAAQLARRAGALDRAVALYRTALTRGSRSEETLNNLAWLLATSQAADAAARAEAVALAEEAAALSERRTAAVLDTLAIAYATEGRLAEAGQAAREALTLAEANGDVALAESLRERLARYER